MSPSRRMLNTALAAAVLVSIASCGSNGSGSGANSSGGSGAGGSIILSGDGGSGGGGVGGAAGSGGSVGGGPVTLPDGATLEACTAIGATRTCCGNGTQTCVGNEFATWTQCVDSTGAPVNCSVTGGGCDFANGCEAGVDSGPPPPPPGNNPPPPPADCSNQSISNEPEILVGYSPASGQMVSLHGQIKVWVSDENSPFIAPGEQVDNTTGAVVSPGDRTATANDGLLYEPALYFAPQSPTNGGTPNFPQWIKGSYNNNPPNRGTFTGGAPIDPIPAGARTLQYTGEFLWDVGALGLTPGAYTAVFSVHDGDHDRAIGCIGIVVTP